MQYKKLQGGQIHNTTRGNIKLLQFVKRMLAGRFCLAGQIRPADRRLSTPDLDRVFSV